MQDNMIRIEFYPQGFTFGTKPTLKGLLKFNTQDGCSAQSCLVHIEDGSISFTPDIGKKDIGSYMGNCVVNQMARNIAKTYFDALTNKIPCVWVRLTKKNQL